ncbi:hypothetical protein RHODO2019_10795 [Rhodococcus antarcticus]|uniref:Uncharacterized protein n=1 Tax=Rhodococcus antarcticus TaxID=2987751 RepID=A0ABY6NWC6_9NOCA|nr:hypothetical protein [Rhodococcus antarcticus]UZJ23695.1 hypothetical protein RHODO2019_10795 [Rhodococcus antarcticus]
MSNETDTPSTTAAEQWGALFSRESAVEALTAYDEAVARHEKNLEDALEEAPMGYVDLTPGEWEAHDDAMKDSAHDLAGALRDLLTRTS